MGKVQLFIERYNSCLVNRFYPKFRLFVSPPGPECNYAVDNWRPLLTAQKMQLLRSDYYSITLDPNTMAKTAPGYVGKLRSNLLGTEFSLYGAGANPSTGLPPDRLRNQHAAIFYVYSQASLQCNYRNPA